jgi:Ni,Fe-hydrogenase maturation factor
MLQIYEKIAEKIAHKRVFLTFLSLILIQTFALAQNDSKITIQQKNITVIDALKTVEKQSKMSINYSDSELTGKVIAQLNLQNASLETALDTILKGTGFSFQIQGNYIIIAEKKPVVAQILKNIKGKVTDESGEPLIGVNLWMVVLQVRLPISMVTLRSRQQRNLFSKYLISDMLHR